MLQLPIVPGLRLPRRVRALLTCLLLGTPLAGALAAPHMATGGSGHTQVLDGDGRVFTWGYNKYGTAGDGSTLEAPPHAQTTPRRAAIEGVVGIASGQGANFAVRSDGTVWSWGFGYLGHGAYEGRTIPTQVAGLAHARQVASGLFHTLVLRHDGSVMAWGNNSRGAVGDGSTAHRAAPVGPVLGGVRAIAAHGHSLALKSDGTVWAWGENNVGQAGGVAGQNPAVPRQVEGLRDVTAIAAGALHSVALKADGSVWAWGEGVALGDGRNTSSATPVRASVDGVVAIAAGSGFTLALRADGSVWAFGIVRYNGGSSSTASMLPAPVPELVGVRAIGAGMFHRVAILADGSVFTWGMNDVGQLGNGQSGSPVNTPMRVLRLEGGSLVLQPPTPPKTDTDRLFNWAEATYPHLFPTRVVSSWISGYYARCYPTGLCVGEANGRAYFYDGTVQDVGGVAEMLNAHAIPAGF